MNQHECLALDAEDPLASLRDLFDLPDGVTYLDGNSLGVLPKAAAARVQQIVKEEWGRDLIRSWNTAGWIDMPQRIGNKIGQLIGASDGEVVVADSTSVNLYKVLTAALNLQRADSPQRKVIVSERHNFPTDLYIAEGIARERGLELRLVEAGDIGVQLNNDIAVLMLTHVNYRTGRMHDMARITRDAHSAGALVVWDLAHSAGAVPVDLTSAEADFAVGCGYKYLNGGPGAPAFAWAHPKHTARMDAVQLWQPLSGWLGHAAPFEFTPNYRPAAGISRFICGTPPVLSMAALECGVDTLLAAAPLGGMPALREKSLALTELFILLVEERCSNHGLMLRTPRDASMRGSQVSLSREEGGYPKYGSVKRPSTPNSVRAEISKPGHPARHTLRYLRANGFTEPCCGYAIMQALIARGVIGDFRSPDILRFGFTPLYTRFIDVWNAVEQLLQVMQSGEWREARFNQRAAVT